VELLRSLTEPAAVEGLQDLREPGDALIGIGVGSAKLRRLLWFFYRRIDNAWALQLMVPDRADDLVRAYS